MKLICRPYIYVGYYCEFLSSNTYVSHQNESHQQSPEKMKTNGEHERQY